MNESYKIITKTILLHYYLLSNNKEKDLDRLYRTELRNYIIDNYKIIREAISDDKELKIELDLFRVNYSLSRIYVILNKILRKLKIKNSINIYEE